MPLTSHKQARLLTIAVPLAILVVLLSSAPGLAQKKLPSLPGGLTFGRADTVKADVEVSAKLVPVDAQTVELQVTARLPADYWIYSMDPSFDGGSRITLTETHGLQPADEPWKADRPPKIVDDPALNQRVEKFFGGVTWSLPLRTPSNSLPPDLTITGELHGQFCGDGSCVLLNPPRTFTARVTKSDAGAVPNAPGGAATAPGAGRTLAPVVLSPQTGFGQRKKPAPIRYTVSLTPESPKPGDEVTLTVHADIERPYHTFALDQDPEMAGTPTSIELTAITGLKALSEVFSPDREPEVERPLEDITQRVHYDEVMWTRKFQVTDPRIRFAGKISYQLCRDGTCLPPSHIEFAIPADVDPAAASTPTPAVAGEDPPGPATDKPPAGDTGQRPAVNASVAGANVGGDGLAAFLITAVSAGFLSLLTPCVFPMVPVTVAFFLKQSEKRSGSPVWLATVYCLGIIGTFTILGLAVTIVFGPAKLNEIANNRWLNLFFAGLFLLFALMLMGMFELRLPSSLLTWSSRGEGLGGVVGALFMALTFTLVSFTCTFAFVGTLLVLAAKGSFFWPIVGMMAFSTAFASPFFILALFPSMLKQLPKSGGWMNTVKVTMGLVELALVLKFLSVADIGFSPNGLPWLLDPTSFLTGWIVIAAVTGIYLLNLFRMSHDTMIEGISALRCCFAICFLCLAAYISAGVFGSAAPTGVLWQQIAAFAPPTEPHHLLDFRVAARQAADQRRLLFLDFTGQNCVNCRLMENTVLSLPAVQAKLSEMIQVQLYTDIVPGIRDPALQNELLEMNRQLQGEWFNDAGLPGYAVVASDGKTVLTKFLGLDKSGGVEFLQFLDAGIQQAQKLQDAEAVAQN